MSSRQAIKIGIVNELCVYVRVCVCARASLAAQMVKNLPLMCETLVQPLGWEDPLEEGMASCSVMSNSENP